MLSTSELFNWKTDDWHNWFADGLDIWFSEWSTADRALAFAPLRITPGRDHIAESVAGYLGRFYKRDSSKHAASSLDLIDAIEEGAAECLRSTITVRTCEHALVLLEVFEILKARRLPTLARLSLQVLPPRAFEGEDAGEYLSRLTYIILDNNVVRDRDPLQGLLETRLRGCENFRPALFYSLQLTDHDVMLSLERFYDLTSGVPGIKSEGIWREVSQEFDYRFGRSAVVDAISRASSSSVMANMDIRGMDAAVHLRPLYQEVEPGGLFQILEDQPVPNEPALRRREIALALSP